MEAALDLSPYVDPLDSATGPLVFPKASARHLDLPEQWALGQEWATSPPVQTIDLAQCWHELASGRRQVAASAASDNHYFLLLTRAVKPSRVRRGIRTRNFRVLSQVLLTPSRKQLAAELGLSASSIAALSKQCLESLGLSCTPCTAPPLLIIAAGAACAQAAGVTGERLTLAPHSPHLELIRTPRPELKFAAAFSRAEFDVAQRLLDGSSYAEIARSRQTSARTIANQVASVFQRVGVSNRNELAQRLLLDSTALGGLSGSRLQ
ncbi:MAG TPA: LuxR C-terminal-related transcriptional regulator [Polyangiaceae bacterium]|nr:LuxR C-terminal-related transcriptional regulator [Polyangiaceae bacterium]